MRRHVKGDLQRELSWFLVAYLTVLLGALLGVHLLQPAPDGAGSASQSPAHQDRQKAAAEAVATRA
jgi:hypothetical protein